MTNPAPVAGENSNGELFDTNGNLVKFKPTKAVIGGVIGFVSLVATGIGTILPDDDTVSTIVAITGVVVGSAAVVLGIYIPANKRV